MRSSALLVLLASACAAAPSEDAILACEAYVQELLRSPSTYKRIEASQFIAVGGKEGYVSLEYDAANAFGTPIRDTQTCRFPTPGGRWAKLDDMKHQARMAAIGTDGTCCMPKPGERAGPVTEQEILDATGMSGADVNRQADEAIAAADAALANANAAIANTEALDGESGR